MTGPRLSRWAGALACAALPLATMACDRISSFDTGPDEAFCGQITLASGYRTGFTPRVQMRMTFDSSKVDNDESPGTLTTFDAGQETGPQLLAKAPLRPIPPLSHDPLSELEFGDGRDFNLIYAVSPTSPEAESALAVVSLRADDAVGVRLIRPGKDGADPAAPAGQEPLFGLFLLRRQDGDCGF
jgi:hypothetical protein